MSCLDVDRALYFVVTQGEIRDEKKQTQLLSKRSIPERWH